MNNEKLLSPVRENCMRDYMREDRVETCSLLYLIIVNLIIEAFTVFGSEGFLSIMNSLSYFFTGNDYSISSK
jgi:hypothetical protein